VKRFRPSSKGDNGSMIGSSALLASIRKRISTVEASPLAAIGLLGAALWLFLTIAEAVVEGETAAWDRRLLLALRNAVDPAMPWGPPWVQEMARDFTALGGVAVLTLMTLAVIGYLLLARKRPLPYWSLSRAG
jgi:undecaprenyl-diphosphatase